MASEQNTQSHTSSYVGALSSSTVTPRVPKNWNNHPLTSKQPTPPDRLNQITQDACDSTFGTTTSYDHSQTSSWNTSIINAILQSLISTTSTPNAPPAYKYAVTSTIIQHNSPPAPRHPTVDDFPRPPSSIAGASEATLGGGDEEHATVPGMVSDERAGGKTGAQGKASVGRRGLHSATGAFWDSKNDGMWSFKYDGAEARGFDVVISVVWISI